MTNQKSYFQAAMLDRRTFIKACAGAAGVGAISLTAACSLFEKVSPSTAEEGAISTLLQEVSTMKHELPPLPYAYDALEPHIDAQTMTLHHDKHHLGYVNGLNAAEEKLAAARASGDFPAVKHLSRELAFHGAGHYLHCIFWENMTPNGGGKPSGDLLKQIDKDFGGFDPFMAHFKAASNAVEASGWGILGYHKLAGGLQILQSEKHQNLTQWGIEPLLVIDVWEHAYYLKYQNKRPDYVNAFANVINWDDVSKRLAAAKK